MFPLSGVIAVKELKNCPFCGAGAEIVRRPGQRDGARFTAVSVRCVVCWAKTREFFVSVVDEMAMEGAENSAVRQWNRREGEEKGHH